MMDRTFVIETTLQRGDYRKCLCASTLKLNLGYAVLMVICSGIIGIMYGTHGQFKMDYTRFLKGTLFTFCVMLLICLVAIVVDCEKRIHTRMAEKLGKVKTMSFFEDYLKREYKELGDVRKIYYDQIYRVVEQRNYICLYYTSTAMSAVRRKDMSEQDWERLKDILRLKCSYGG